jgi:hypothetical protein
MRQDVDGWKALSALSTVCARWWQGDGGSRRVAGQTFFLFPSAKG